MTPPAARHKLRLAPEHCDGCGRCVRECAPGALKVGTGYIYVDWAKCDGCAECADVCDRGAIEPVGLPARVERVAVAGQAVRAVADGAAGSGVPGYLRRFLGAGDSEPVVDASTTPAQAVSPPTPSWTLGEALVLLGAVLTLLVAKDLALASEAVRDLSLEALVWVRALVLGVYYLVATALVVSLAARKGAGVLASLRLRLSGHGAMAMLRSGLLVLGMLVMTRLATTGYAALALAFGWRPPGPGETEFVALFGTGASGLLISSVLVVLVAPVVEELVFRGAVLGALSGRMPRWAAVTASALLFAALHLDAWMFVPTAVLGLALGWLASRRSTLWPAIVMHALYNATAVAAAYYMARAV